MKNKVKGAVICCIVLIIAMTTTFQAGAAEKKQTGIISSTADNQLVFSRANTYKEYLTDKADVERPIDSILMKASSYTANNAADIEIKKDFLETNDILVWRSKTGSLEWQADVSQEGLYHIQIRYCALSVTAKNIELKLLINGDKLFDAASRLILPRTWHDSSSITQDARGNDIRPKAVADERWLVQDFTDTEGIYNDPFEFYFTKGLNTINLETQNGQFAIDYIRIYNEEAAPGYSEYKKNRSNFDAVNNVKEIIQGEDTLYKSDTVLYPTYDRSTSETIPNDPVKLRLNTIGQRGWGTQGQFIAWKVAAPKAGYYKLGIKFRQNISRGLTSYRRLTINGELPFEEASNIPFQFSDKWQSVIIGNQEEAYEFFLDAGENEILMTAVPGPTGEIIEELEDISYSLGLFYKKIIIITGISPDPYRDYHLEKEIPGLMEGFITVKERLTKCIEKIKKTGSSKNIADGVAVLNTLIVQLASFVENPDTIPVRLNNYQINISSFADYTMSLKSQPLEIDYFAVLSPDQSEFVIKQSWYEKLAFHFNSFLGSFTNDYSSIGNIYEEDEAIDVWINLGRDQVQVVKELTENTFTPDTNIFVNVKLVQQSLVPAILSGNGPDVTLFVTDPVSLAARNGLYDISKFGNFNDVIGQFSQYALENYKYNGGCYALPVTQDFPVLFCRTDIFEELELTPPETWEEFYKVLTIIQKNNMTVGIPNIISSVGPMATNNTIFSMLLYQRGMTLYNADLSATNLNTTEAVEAFKQWTGFYSRYSLPVEYSFYQRFRTGIMPMAIEAYTTYNLLKVAAPEIRNLWEMFPIPGYKNSNGTINRTIIGSGTCAVILKNSDNPEAAWKYLQWFTGVDAQTQYGLQIESILGPAGRYSTANQIAFESLPWTSSEASKIKEAWQNVVEIPGMPTAYYVDRNLTNAFRKAVYYYKNPRETLLNYNNEINLEITRKRKEFGLD